MRFVLASASPARRRLLADAGITAEAVPSGVDESRYDGPPAQLVCDLARAKCRAVAGSLTGDGLVLGCDSLLELDGVGYGKPADAAEVRDRWRLLAGRSGVLHTGHCLRDVAGTAERVELGSTVVHFGSPSEREIAAYTESGEPLLVAGGFAIDGYGGWFVDQIEGDHGTVLGLSLPILRGMLAAFGYSPADLWPAGRDPTG